MNRERSKSLGQVFFKGDVDAKSHFGAHLLRASTPMSEILNRSSVCCVDCLQFVLLSRFLWYNVEVVKQCNFKGVFILCGLFMLWALQSSPH